MERRQEPGRLYEKVADRISGEYGLATYHDD